MTAATTNAEQLHAVAGRLVDIARGVATEASGLTGAMRAIGDHARDIAALAAEMDAASATIEDSMQAQLRLLAKAQELVADNAPVMAALAGSAETITTICRQVREIADKSRLVSLNARIEAARSDGGSAFGSVATAMTDLAAQTRDATREIGISAEAITGNVAAAHDVILGGVQLVELERRVVTDVAGTSAEQRETASRVAALTAQTVERLDGAAAGIGRVASAASVIGVLARSLAPQGDAGIAAA